MKITNYPDIDILLTDLLEHLQLILSEDLKAVYLSGSLVWGDFDRQISDLDLLAVLQTESDDDRFTALEHMHTVFAAENPTWFNRIEVHYVTEATLQHPLEPEGTMLVISPGEPLNKKVATAHYLMNWYLVQEQSVALYGPDPHVLIAPISQSAFLKNIKCHVKTWQSWIDEEEHIKGKSYAVLTMCRAMYSLQFSKQGSKKQAAEWVQKNYPEWAELIQKALELRVLPDDLIVDEKTMHVASKVFVRFTLQEIEKKIT